MFCSWSNILNTAGYFGMQVATKANARTANAAQHGQNEALGIAFRGGAVMGMCVVGLGILGVGALYMLFKDANIVTGFGLGASSIALFARVGGGIYTKAADVGADLVGKVEAGIPEDDPRNPAIIADNVGDNVGDVAGMGADLFESYVGSIISYNIGSCYKCYSGRRSISLVLAAIGVIVSIIGTMFVRTMRRQILRRIDERYLCKFHYGNHSFILPKQILVWKSGIFAAVTAGVVAGSIIGFITEVYTSGDYKYVKE